MHTVAAYSSAFSPIGPGFQLPLYNRFTDPSMVTEKTGHSHSGRVGEISQKSKWAWSEKKRKPECRERGISISLIAHSICKGPK